jgi:starch synthase (maltosyl-transferring)
MSAQRSAPPRIYNLFPRLIGDLARWPEVARHARAMGFDWLYVNPFHYPGFSGSMYAVKDYYRVDPLLLPPDHPDAHYGERVGGDGGIGLLRDTIAAIRTLGLHPMMDLVVNHTARDAELTATHADWYVRDASGAIQSPHAIDPADARRVTVWGDLAEIDNAASPDRDRLWQYWADLVTFYAELGFAGFRADAAYKVPAALWAHLVARARAVRPEATFFAETLGARLEEIAALRPAGFDYLFSSLKWWDLSAPWCLEQQRDHATIAPSVSFAESHDTPRLMTETGGSVAVQKQRYALAAAFSTAVLMPIDYERGARRRLDVVATRASHREPAACDLSAFIARVNAAKIRFPALAAEEVTAASPLAAPTLLLAKRAGDARAWIAVNKDWHAAHELTLDGAGPARVLRVCADSADTGEAAAPAEPAGPRLRLAPAEVAYLVPGT